MAIKALIIVYLTYISLAESTLAPFITKCKADDSKCLKESGQKAVPLFADGIPELNVKPLDPMTLKHVDASTPNLNLVLTDVDVVGIKKCEIKKIQRNLETSKLIVKVQCPHINIKGKYDMKGQLFVLPIEGNGDVIGLIKKLLIIVEAEMADKVGDDGKKHWSVKSWKHNFELKGSSDVKFENLFPNNEFLRTTTSELIAQNGNGVITEVGPPLIKDVVTKVVENVHNLFTAVPAEDLALD